MSDVRISPTTRCAACGGPLPAPADTMTIVCASDGETLSTCSTACMAELLVDLAWEPAAGSLQ